MAQLDEQRLARLLVAHQERFGNAPTIVARAPGRINLIGEHTDYNGGYVLPAAIDRDVLLVASSRADRRLRLHSLQLPELADRDLDALKPEGVWHDYVAGVAAMLQELGHRLRGLEATIDGTVPPGGGLSSSAALEVSAGLALVTLAGLEVSRRDLALLCQRAEHDFVGAQVGVMDQFISLFGEDDAALFLDCRSLATEQIPLQLADEKLALVVCDSGVKHAIAGGEYNRRRAECGEAVAVLRATYSHITQLRDLTPEQFATAATLFSPEQQVAFRRARHVISENARVLETVAALRRGDWEAVGEALYASHASLRDDYEVSVPEIDALVEIARATPGVLGSRLMGGGFGGSTLTLLHRDAVDAFTLAVEAGVARAVYPVAIVAGATVNPVAA